VGSRGKRKWAGPATLQRAAGRLTGGSTCQWVLITEAVRVNGGRWIKRRIDSSGSSPSTNRTRRRPNPTGGQRSHDVRLTSVQRGRRVGLTAAETTASRWRVEGAAEVAWSFSSVELLRRRSPVKLEQLRWQCGGEEGRGESEEVGERGDVEFEGWSGLYL
jgi:hypothetical protein